MTVFSTVRSFDLVALLLLASVVAGSNPANASGKIYLGGKWVESTAQEFDAGSVNVKIPGFDSLGLGNSSQDLKAKVLSFLSGNAGVLGTNLGSVSWGEPVVSQNETMQTHRVKKLWNGLEVLGGEALVHLKDGKVLFASADAATLGHLSAAARVSAQEAGKIAFSSYRGSALRAEAPELKVLSLQKDARLVYEVKVVDLDGLSSDVHFIDAHDGQEALVTTNVHTAANRKVLAGTGGRDDMSIVTDTDAENLINTKFTTLYSDRGCDASGGFNFWDRWSRNASPTAGNTSCNNAAPDVMASALSAWSNSGKVYDYYSQAHRRDSVDGSGMMIRSVVNFGGPGFRNAAWYNDRKIMLYGMGDGQRFNDFASSVDVVAHEITHGVTSNTANLVYAAESGALNESYSDVFGKLVAFRAGRPADWKIGKDLFRDGTSFIRDMENPEVGHTKDFKYRNQPCNRFNDNCGVHDNSGIPNKAAVMIAKRLGLDRFGKLYYLTLTQLLRSNSDFAEARAQTEAACATLFGAGSQDCRAVTEAFTAVGI